MVPQTTTKDNTPNYGIWEKFTELPLIQTTTGAYSMIRDSNWLMTTGIGMMEKSVSLSTSPALSMLLFVVNRCPQKVSTIDKMACEYWDLFGMGVNVAQSTAEELAHTLKVAVEGAAFKTASKTCSSYPGRLVLSGIDGLLKVSERALEHINDEYVIQATKPETEVHETIPEGTLSETEDVEETEETEETEEAEETEETIPEDNNDDADENEDGEATTDEAQ